MVELPENEMIIIGWMVNLGIIAIYFPTLIGLILIHKIPRYLVLLWIAIAIGNIESHFMVNLKYLPAYHNAYAIFHYILMSMVYWDILSGKWPKRSILIASLAFISLATVHFLFCGNFIEEFRLLSFIASVTFTIYSLIYFYQLFTKKNAIRLRDSPGFWINIAILLYYAGNLVLFAAITIYSMWDIYMFFYIIHGSLMITKHLIYTVAFIVNLNNLSISWTHRN